MRYGIRHFHRPVCAYPDCGNEYDGDEAEWWSDPYWPLDQAWEDDWLVLDGRLGEPDPRLPAVRSSCVDDVLAVLRKD